MSASQAVPARLRLAEYYAIAGVNAVASPLFNCCLVFWTKERLGYTDCDNLLLSAVGGAVYIVAAWRGGKLADTIGYDRFIVVALAIAALCLGVGWLPVWRFTPFVVVALYTVCMAAIWTALEAVTQHAPARLNMPQRAGIYNIIWAVACIMAYLLGGALYRWHPVLAFLVPAALHAGQAGWMLRPVKRRRPRTWIPPDSAHRGDSVATGVKLVFVRTAWVVNGMSYFFSSALAALMPAVGLCLGFSAAQTIWLFCILQVTRLLGFILFWYWERWHYRMVWSVSAAALAPVGLAALFFAPWLWLVVVALMLLGLTQALSYSISLYYSLDMGGHKGAYSGIHEALIGAGVFLGPLAGVAGSVVVGGTAAAEAVVVALGTAITAAGILWARRTIRNG